MPNKRTNPYYQAQVILSRRDHSVFELQTKMRRKRFTTSQINSAVGKLKKIKLLDDHTFAQKYIEDALRFKDVGPRWLAYRLKQKGISENIIDQTISEAFFEGREAKLVSKAAQKWQRLHPSTGSGQAPRDRQRLTRFLTSRGFSFTQIDSVIK